MVDRELGIGRLVSLVDFMGDWRDSRERDSDAASDKGKVSDFAL